MADMRSQAIMGVVPPESGEARIVVRWPSVAAYPAVAKLGSSIQLAAKNLIASVLNLHVVLAAILILPVTAIATLMALAAWGILAPFYFKKVLPLFATRYALTNQRIMIQKGLTRKTHREVPLDQIEAVRVVAGSEQPFYLAADLEIVANGRTALTLPGVKEYESLKRAIENAYLAWGRKAPPKEQIHPATELAGKK